MHIHVRMYIHVCIYTYVCTYARDTFSLLRIFSCSRLYCSLNHVSHWLSVRPSCDAFRFFFCSVCARSFINNVRFVRGALANASHVQLPLLRGAYASELSLKAWAALDTVAHACITNEVSHTVFCFCFFTFFGVPYY